jgi:phage shock protein C
VNPRRLYRSRHDRPLTGVAGGIAEYFEIDPTIVRILWILSAFLGGFTILLYIILAVVVPLEPAPMPAPGPWATGGPGTGAMPTPGEGGEADAGAASEAAAGTDPVSGTGWQGGGATGYPGWTPPARDAGDGDRREGRGTIFLGVLLVVFGSIALIGALVPSWVSGAALGPAFVLALGIALVVGSTRRTASER